MPLTLLRPEPDRAWNAPPDKPSASVSAPRLAATAVGLVLLVAACSGTAPPPEPRPSPSGSPPAAEPTPTATGSPDLGKLRVTTLNWKTDFTKTNIDLSEIISGGPPKDGIPAIDEPRFESIAAARAWLADQSPVIALEVDGDARAYPLAILIWHEIVNDTVGGAPLVVTFCPLCNTALVFERRIDDRILDFGTTGNLRFSDLVMYDRQTETWWQQAIGEGIVGEYTGRRLTFVPAQIVSLAEFEAAYPSGQVLSRETGYRRQYGRNPYVGYDRVDQSPFLFTGVVDGRLAPMERVVTVGEGEAAFAFPYSELAQTGVAAVTIAGQPIVVLWVPGSASALDAANIDAGRDVGMTGVFRAELDGRTLTFERPTGPTGPIADRETGSSWSVTGRATAGPLAGRALQPVVHGDHFWFAWAAFQPATRIWTAADGPSN